MSDLVHDAAASPATAASNLTLVVDNPPLAPCGWVVPQHYVEQGIVHVRYRCSGCGAVGGEAFGPAGGSFLRLLKAAGALGPHGPIAVG